MYHCKRLSIKTYQDSTGIEVRAGLELGKMLAQKILAGVQQHVDIEDP